MPSGGSPSRGSVNVSLAVPAVAFDQVPEGRVLGVDEVTVDAGARVRDEIDETVVDDHAERLIEGVRFLRRSCPATARVNGGRPGWVQPAPVCPQGPRAGEKQLSSAGNMWSVKTASRIRRVVAPPRGGLLLASGPGGRSGASRVRKSDNVGPYRNPVFVLLPIPRFVGSVVSRCRPDPHLSVRTASGDSPLDGEPSPGRIPSAGTWNLRVGRSLLRRPGDHGRRCTLCSNSSTSATAATWFGICAADLDAIAASLAASLSPGR